MEKSNGKILKCVGGLYTVGLFESSGDETVLCRARGIFRNERRSPVAGDNVTVVCDETPGESSADGSGRIIDTILERRNLLIRPPLANLDLMFITLASASPEPSLFSTDKLTAICEHNGIEPVIVIGKCELDRESTAKLKEIYELAGYRVFAVSCYENEGVGELARYASGALAGKTAAFAGASGVGKSTLLNLIFPGLALGTGEISRHNQRGKHTTRTVELFPVRGGFIADTPGFSMLDFERFDFMSKEELPGTFREFGDCLGDCRYKKCTHIREDGCAVLEKLRAGGIAPSRHESFTALYGILKNKHGWDTK